MSRASIIDGKAFAENLTRKMAEEVASIRETYGLVPGLAVVLVGDDPASQVYVRNKARQTEAVGMRSFEHRLPSETSQKDLLDLIGQLNKNPVVHGILVQLPLPRHLDSASVIDSIDPAKDVDGFHVTNVGRLNAGLPSLIPCTPKGCLMLLKNHLGNLSGKHAVIIGRSNIVGKPMSALLLREHCTVTVVHSRTHDVASECRRADILVAAVGQSEFVRGDWIKPGATVIDVGINRVATTDGSTRLVGDVNLREAQEIAGAITPVPGGVGPMTIACLLQNTLEAALCQIGVNR
ncbi:MAG TPA: bifunctional methylenetetrahydrofolate dehydrogenase/methenyltetrahydrofolate cyclohydrolase FolD [Noviherbaspirillum sp.]|uniref:bifunctional methylenetetrahydrofolate dehydrogenase/methenyltetrahydrofolate cyclohydrolase FolD n=1 Tax=Noviherbaspirillum sp. TaxID=1926288 RepID=UPI002B47874A|nr:bifunctional methylenetetrahydrofolate dehydrogenase/methenyltetrahydrofolate cyclohydrolase FolD [Noviherbaspirillum sp.]HJV88209.1 bifunctional methylenetetrahydrofolate dehydrogenase/methenyltetrahydrofolate cyclohydrolase FolD [Noviherbaspirillum sp.]